MTNDVVPTNWGRWGPDDQLGTLRYIDSDATARAATAVRSGRHVSLARPITPVPLSGGGAPVGTSTPMPAAVMQVVNFTGMEPMAMTDTLVINTHNAALTHIDAVSHIPVEGRVYPGVPVNEAVTVGGVGHGAGDVFGTGIVTRGVFLDVAPGTRLHADHRIDAADMETAAQRAGGVYRGDAIVLRAGWDTNQPMDQSVPGLDVSAVAWLHDQAVSIYLGDVADARPWSPPLAVHQIALARLGMPLVDAVAVDELAEVCKTEQRHSFLLVVAPPRITGTTGIAVNPIAIF